MFNILIPSENSNQTSATLST